MLPINSKRRELKAREAILRGVYEDNLKIIGGQSAAPDWRIPLFVKKMILFYSVLLLTILGQGSYLDLPLFPERQMAAGIITQEQQPLSPPEADENQITSSDYQEFLGSAPLSRMFGLGVKTIMIDAGHGGDDPGTAGKMGTKEKDITLDIAKKLKERLKRRGSYNIIMTREEDITLPLNKRVELARASKADIFISIHLNYLPSKPINIIETYYFGPSSDVKTLRLAEQENAGSQYGLSDFKDIIEKMGKTLKLHESKELAASIQKNLFINSKKKNNSIHNLGIKRAPFVVLLGVDIPAVLAEVSCLSNRQEEIELSFESHRENIARYIEAGILDYLNKGDTNYEAKRNTGRR